WNIAWLMTRLGLRPMIEPNRPLVIAGLPEGTYEVGIGEETAVFSVRGSRETRALLPE
ncbi:MAG: hypothetical protein GY835_11710, partial [bacterium]|nr:hypothetical protein [bacterium]